MLWREVISAPKNMQFTKRNTTILTVFFALRLISSTPPFQKDLSNNLIPSLKSQSLHVTSTYIFRLPSGYFPIVCISYFSVFSCGWCYTLHLGPLPHSSACLLSPASYLLSSGVPTLWKSLTPKAGTGMISLLLLSSTPFKCLHYNSYA